MLVWVNLPVGHGAEVPTASAVLTAFCPARSHSHHTVEARVAASLTGSSRPGAGSNRPRSLARHRDPKPLLRADQVVMVVGAEIDLHPVHHAAEDASRRGLVVADRGGGVARPRSAVSSKERVKGTVAGSRPSPNLLAVEPS